MVMEELPRSPHRTQDLIVAGVALLVAFPLSIISFAGAVRARGWTRWRLAIGSFAAAAWLTYPAQFIFVFLLVPDERRDLLFGAYVFAVAMIWLPWPRCAATGPTAARPRRFLSADGPATHSLAGT